MIIPVHHTVVANYPVATTETFEQGMVVALDSNGYAVKCDADAGDSTAVPVGLAADRNRASEAFEFVNRVSDSGNDTAASGNMSVYQGSGGVFYVDVNDSAIQTPGGTTITGILENSSVTTPGTLLYASGSNDGLLDDAQTGSGLLVAIITEDTGDLANGIPDEYEPGASFELADDSVNRQWVKIKLVI